jgi:hypothetical protein
MSPEQIMTLARQFWAHAYNAHDCRRSGNEDSAKAWLSSCNEIYAKLKREFDENPLGFSPEVLDRLHRGRVLGGRADPLGLELRLEQMMAQLVAHEESRRAAQHARRGTIEASGESRRESRCWSCGRGLSSEWCWTCKTCAWMKCPCGACNCSAR